MKESAFNNKIIELCGNDTMTQYNFLESLNKNILSNSGEKNRWKLFNPNGNHTNIEDGVYMTIRCGYGGIYQTYNIWDSTNGKWKVSFADGSYTIMYKDIEEFL